MEPFEPSSGVFVLPTTTSPGALPPHQDLAVVIAGPAVEEAAAAAGGDARVGDDEVLEKEGHAGERPLGERCGHRGTRLVRHHVDDGVELAIERVDGCERVLDELARRGIAAPDEGGKSDRVVVCIVDQGLHGSLLSPSRAAYSYSKQATRWLPPTSISGGSRSEQTGIRFGQRV